MGEQSRPARRCHRAPALTRSTGRGVEAVIGAGLNNLIQR